MSNVAIRAENVSKHYRLGTKTEAYKTLRESISNLLTAPARNVPGRRWSADAKKSSDASEIWALKDVSFEIKHGEAVGIIGHNGAGKSTLLKILSRITEPTAGRVELRGRVGSLLEIGAGFHPELTGRENIYLNGAILGMSRAEIQQRFDAIVAFAEIERFLDTPVKRYSTGMYMRLAFSVAAHLEPEILLVDEVLAVGDVAFQAKCLRRMDELGQEGRTVIFISHNMPTIQALCRHCLVLDRGRIVASGPTRPAIQQYLGANRPASTSVVDLHDHPGRKADRLQYRILDDRVSAMREARLTFGPGSPDRATLPVGGHLTLTVSYTCTSPIPRPVLGVVIKNRSGTEVLSLSNRFSGAYPSHDPATAGTITLRLNSCPFAPGHYTMDLWLGDIYDYHDMIRDAAGFDVSLEPDILGTDFVAGSGLGDLGVIVWPASWDFERQEDV